ncbi:unnamed protein product [Schistocephalus solidus]|uniref:Insulin-like growth factor-binding protein-related protein 1 n=1 Tax=Schistocephalus solidus TaxID=70667 RepID=A0A183SH46_SCHSO|nr:unnamed protein product [Schistocephalus solidus]
MMSSSASCPLLLLLLLFLLSALTAAFEDLEYAEPCGPCDYSKCPPVTQCPVGVVRDACGCCNVCGLEQGHRCNTPEELADFAAGRAHRGWYGQCGKDLECRARKDVDDEFLGKENICFCTKPGRLCASDGNTYSVCEFAAVRAGSNGAIELLSYDDCKSEPKILDASPSVSVVDGSKTTFWCEIKGYPLPTVSWYFMRPDDTYDATLLPGDSDDISVSLRGAPPGRRIISHLQIRKFGREHEGTYQCFVENDFGSDRHNITAVYVAKMQSRSSDELAFGGWRNEV